MSSRVEQRKKREHIHDDCQWNFLHLHQSKQRAFKCCIQLHQKKWNVQFTNPLPLPELLKRYTVKVSSTEYSTSDSENGHKMFKNCVEALYSINFPVALNKLDAEFEVSKHSYRA